ncbi:hypothetical protein [Clostridium sp. Marseille-P2415]|uniref:hypothetical protein n=1 Tax=Clostridium sp. Marseille-P2415 TaxID=1805471 RepID=UPI000988339F|nr:hypothetical protein [Clostridium sp. Marseille-P2415]
MERYTEEMKLWLFDLAHGNLNDEDILKGFIRHYVLYDFGTDQVVNDIVFHTIYGTEGVIKAKESIIKVLNQTIQN